MNKIYLQIWLWLGLMIMGQISVAQTVDLTSLETGITNLPAGTTVTWHTGTPATNLNQLANPANAGAGITYYAFFYDAANDCYSSEGTSVPTAINDCNVGVSVDLTTLETGISNLPAGTTVSWHTAQPADASNEVSNATTITISGTYYAAFYDAVNDCYSSATSPVLVSIDPCCDLVAPAIIKN